jgi:hypothetical protein
LRPSTLKLTANVREFTLISEIAAAVEKAMAERAGRTGLTADMVVDELRKIAPHRLP